MSIEEMIERRFVCTKCRHNHYLFVACSSCGYVEVFDPDVLKGKKQGQVGTILDILFGG